MATGTDSCIATIHEEFLLCKMCLEELQEPKSLPCLHTFCLQCLEQHARQNRRRNNKLACPICRKDCKIPFRGIKNFPTNFMLQELTDVVQTSKNQTKAQMCTHHPSLVSEWFCTTCYACICHICQQYQHSRQPCNIIDMNNEGQFINALNELQQEKTTDVQNKMKNWSKECLDISNKVKEIQKSKEDLKEKANVLYEDIEEKIKEEKKLIHRRIDQLFEQVNRGDFLAKYKEFEKEMTSTIVLLQKTENSRQKHDLIETAIKNWNDINPLLCKQVQDLENSYEVVRREKKTRSPKVELKVMEETLETIKNKPLLKIQAERDIGNIRCTPNMDFNPKFWLEDKVKFGDIVCELNKLYFIDSGNDCVKMMDEDGTDGMLGFGDRCDHEEKPWSLCYLPGNDNFVVSYCLTNEIKIFDSSGKFKAKTYISGQGATLLPLSDDTIAVGHEDNYIDFYDFDLVRILDIPRLHWYTRPKNMCADKDNNIFFSDSRNVYFWDRKKDEISNLSESMNEFNPCGLCVDRWGYLLVASQWFSKIHIFSQGANGSWDEKTLLGEKPHEVRGPTSMAFDKEDLVVAQDNGKIKTYSYTNLSNE